MKYVVIGTDFSAAAKNAFEYGVQLAERLQAKVVLVHGCEMVPPALDVGPLFSPEELKEETVLRLNAAIRALPFKPEVNITPRAIGLDAIEAVLAVASDLPESLVIVGMKGRGKAFRKLFGSTATVLARKCSRPLIVVPQHIKFRPITRLAFATDINESTEMKLFDPMIEIGEKFNATAYLVRVIRKRNDEFEELLFRPSVLKWHLRSLHPSMEFIRDFDVAHALNMFVEQHRIDLLCMLSQEHPLLDRLIFRSNVRQMLFEANVPLLIIPEFHGKGKDFEMSGSRLERSVEG